MRENSFADIYKVCNAGATNREKNILRNTRYTEPLLMDIELTNSCNLQCYMCPTGTGSMKRIKGFMPQNVMDKIVEELRDSSVAGIRFILWGEPTLHPRFLEFAKRIKDSGILVHFNTNGILLTEEMIRALIDMEIDSVKFSFQGVDQKSYEEMRFGSNWNRLVNNIKMMHNMRGEKEKPYIQISTTVTDESKEGVQNFINEMQPLCEYVSVGQTILNHLNVDKMNISEERRRDFEKLRERQSLIEKHFEVCPEIYNKLSILWNGDVTMCCNDFEGRDMVLSNILEHSLRELWNSPKAINICKMLEDTQQYDKIGICSICYEYIALES